MDKIAHAAFSAVALLAFFGMVLVAIALSM
jgi:hypothetical protein